MPLPSGGLKRDDPPPDSMNLPWTFLPLRIRVDPLMTVRASKTARFRAPVFSPNIPSSCPRHTPAHGLTFSPALSAGCAFPVKHVYLLTELPVPSKAAETCLHCSQVTFLPPHPNFDFRVISFFSVFPLSASFIPQHKFFFVRREVISQPSSRVPWRICPSC